MLFYTLRKENSELGALADPLSFYLQQLLPLLAVLLSLLMVSRIPYPHVVNIAFRGEKTFAHIVAIVFGLMAVFAFRRYSLPVICTCFALVPPIWFLIRRAWQHRTKEEPLFE
jgi:phosphatidylserine synthase